MAEGVNEAAEGKEFIFARLTGDATLLTFLPGGVWPEMAPPGTATPFAVISTHSETDTLTATAKRLLAMPLYQVKAVGPATQRPTVRSAANRIDALLSRVSGTTANAVIEACYRDGALDTGELVDGALWTNLGGYYRCEIA